MYVSMCVFVCLDVCVHLKVKEIIGKKAFHSTENVTWLMFADVSPFSSFKKTLLKGKSVSSDTILYTPELVVMWELYFFCYICLSSHIIYSDLEEEKKLNIEI